MSILVSSSKRCNMRHKRQSEEIKFQVNIKILHL